MDITNRAGVKTRVAKLNVQIDNLCQFLPQGFFLFFFFSLSFFLLISQ